MTVKNAQEWREFYKSAGAIATCRSPRWLLEGCPKCGNKTWHVTNDCWAYCKSCNKGYPTEFPFTSAPLSLFDSDGVHCVFCEGRGEREGLICGDCHGAVTRPIDVVQHYALLADIVRKLRGIKEPLSLHLVESDLWPDEDGAETLTIDTSRVREIVEIINDIIHDLPAQTR